MALNAEKVLKLAGNAVVDSEISCEDFEVLFSFLDAREKAEAENILNLSGIHVTDVCSKDMPDANEGLCRNIACGDKQSLELICRKNEGLVRKCAAAFYRYFRNDMELDDLVQAGYRGLIIAARRYDPERGTAFSTYAVYWIKQAIRREVQECGHRVRIPVHIQESISIMNRISAQLTAEGVPQEQQLDELARRSGMNAEKLRNLLEVRDNFLCETSLDAPLVDDSDTVLGDMLASRAQPSVEDIVESRIDTHSLFRYIDRLNPRERYVISKRFGLRDTETETLEQLSRELNITRERVRQLQEQALAKLRAMMAGPYPISA